MVRQLVRYANTVWAHMALSHRSPDESAGVHQPWRGCPSWRASCRGTGV